MGRYICNELGSRGSLCFIPYRGCEWEVRHIRQMFDHGQLGLMPFSPRDEESVYNAVKNSDIVINLIGKDYETEHLVSSVRPDGSRSRVNYSFEDTNVEVARTIARISKEAGVKGLVHVSALAADLNSESEWSRTKAQGEHAVRAEFPEAIIVRPSTVFGPEDKFLNLVGAATEHLPFLPMVNGGRNRVQPVHVNDVGTALNRIINGYANLEGETFVLAGPEEYTYREIVEFVMDLTGNHTSMVDVPTPFISGFAGLYEKWVQPVFTADLVKRMSEDNVFLPYDNLRTFADLGIVPGSMEEHAFDYMHRFRQGGHFKMVEGYYATDADRLRRDSMST